MNGNWIEVGCTEGDSGPDLPPPAYFKGILRFGSEQSLRLSSKLFDDKECKAARPTQVQEIALKYQIDPEFKTTDGSIPINYVIALPGYEPVSYYSLVKIKDGRLHLAAYLRASLRPKAMDEEGAQVFMMM